MSYLSPEIREIRPKRRDNLRCMGEFMQKRKWKREGVMHSESGDNDDDDGDDDESVRVR